MVILLSRAFYLQVIKGQTFRHDAEGNRVSLVSIPAPRGIIYDARDTQLVENIASTNVVLDPAKLQGSDAETILLEKLPKILGLPGQEVKDALMRAKETQRITTLANAISHESTLELEKALPDLPGIRLAASLVRKYKDGQALAPLLGYTSPVTTEELKTRPDLRGTDITGKAGLESFYEKQMRGRDGVSYVEVNASGKAQKQLEQTAPAPGSALKLNLDLQLQNYIFSLWRDRAESHPDKKTSGAVVALDPNSGALRALVSYPSYDPNIFSQPALRDQAPRVFKDEMRPLFNRACAGTYPPGSTIKPLFAAATLQEKIITPESTVLSTGGIAIGPWKFLDWKAGGHGVTNVTKAIAESVNSFFYLAIGGDETHQGLGVQRSTKYLKQFGWGSPTGIDLPTEAAGFLPSPEWKTKTKKESWYIGDTYHLAIGQGDVLVTPLQLAMATAAIANGGRVYQPLIVNNIKNADGGTTTLKPKSHAVAVSAENLAVVRQGMRATVLDGSGRALSTLPIALAGKTGTTQIGGTENTHAWFSSFGPYDKPELVLVILIEEGGGGDTEAVPMAKQIWEWWTDQQDR